MTTLMNPHKPITQIQGLSRYCCWEKLDLKVNPWNMQNASANFFSYMLDIKGTGQALHSGGGETPESLTLCGPNPEYSRGVHECGSGGMGLCDMSHNSRMASSLFSKIHFYLCLCVFVSVCHVCVGACGGWKKGHQISWSQSYQQLWTTNVDAENWTLSFGKTRALSLSF